MKKFIFLLAISLFPGIMMAEGFKGFVDLFAGTGVMSEGKSFSYNSDHYHGIRQDLAFGLNITEGYQVNRSFFAGIGFGGYATMMGWKSEDDSDYNEINTIYLPLYADFRWTLNIESTITPFVDLKAGYQFGVRLGSGEMTWNTSSDNLCERGESGFYLVPSVGVRFGKDSAFNLGIAYNPFIRTKYVKISESDPIGDNVVVKSVTNGVLMLTIGADF